MDREAVTVLLESEASKAVAPTKARISGLFTSFDGLVLATDRPVRYAGGFSGDQVIDADDLAALVARRRGALRVMGWWTNWLK